MMRLLTIAIALALLVAGCATGGSGKAPFDDLVYDLTGGIAGFDQHMAISSDGTFQIAEKGKTGKTGKLTAEQFKTVKDLAAKVNFPALKEEYVNPQVADAMFEGLNVKVGDKTYKTVVGTGGAAPQELLDLTTQLRQILTANR